MSISHKLNIVLGVVCTILVGADIYTLGRYRAAVTAGTELERQLTETKQQFEELSQRYDERYSSLENNNIRAKSIAESMGTELQRDGGSLQDAVDLVKQLRVQIEDLQNRVDGSGGGSRNSIDMGDM